MAAKRKKPHVWTTDEDCEIKDHVRTHGPQKWNKLSLVKEKNFTAKQCRARWLDVLDKSINKDPLTEFEKRYIIAQYAIEGGQWEKIASGLPGRTAAKIKNFCNGLIKNNLLERRNCHRQKKNVNRRRCTFGRFEYQIPSGVTQVSEEMGGSSYTRELVLSRVPDHIHAQLNRGFNENCQEIHVIPHNTSVDDV